MVLVVVVVFFFNIGFVFLDRSQMYTADLLYHILNLNIQAEMLSESTLFSPAERNHLSCSALSDALGTRMLLQFMATNFPHQTAPLFKGALGRDVSSSHGAPARRNKQPNVEQKRC